jgi:transposase
MQLSATVMAVDVAKSVFEVAVSTRPGRVTERHRLTRPQFARFVATRPSATVLMEACGTAHYWGRRAQAHGHRVVHLPPQAVRPYVPRNKTNRADATGLLEAAPKEGPLAMVMGKSPGHRSAKTVKAALSRSGPDEGR